MASASFLASAVSYGANVSATYALSPSNVLAASIALWKISPVIPAFFKVSCAAFLAAASADLAAITSSLYGFLGSAIITLTSSAVLAASTFLTAAATSSAER